MKDIIRWIFYVMVKLLYAAVLLHYWKWFITPLGMASINFFHALGLIMFAELIHIQTTMPILSEEESRLDRKVPQDYLNDIFIPIYVLITGFIVHLLM